MVLFCALGPPFHKEEDRFDDGISIFEFEYARVAYGPYSKECKFSLASILRVSLVLTVFFSPVDRVHRADLLTILFIEIE